MGKQYIIIEINTGLYWSNLDGFGYGVQHATIFSEEQKNRVTLPIGGEWLEITS